jgi:hypothetical protein
MVVLREKLELELKKIRGEVNIKKKLMSSDRFTWVLFDCFMMFLHPYPFFVGKKIWVYNVATNNMIYYHWNDIFSMLAVIRICYFMRTTFELSSWRSRSAERVW